jgi:hypothetical protein
MLRVTEILPTALSLIVLAWPAGAQITATTSTQAASAPPHHFQPYTAEFKIMQVQTLADGTTITSDGTEIRARNSAGITMQSNANASWQLGRMLGTSGSVHDTDGTILANWYSVTKQGHIFKMPPREQRRGCWQSSSVRMEWTQAPRATPPPQIVFNPVTRAAEQVPAPVQRSKPKVDELGNISIQGVEARGQRITRTIAVGDVGNDQTFVAYEENWMAPSLGLELRQSIEDPRTGKRTRELVNLTLEEPDPSLFQPPADYNVTTEEMHQVDCKQ